MKLNFLFLAYFLNFISPTFSQVSDSIVVLPKPDDKLLKEDDDEWFFEQISELGISYAPSENFINTDYNRFYLKNLHECFALSIGYFGFSYTFLTSKDNEMMIFTETFVAPKEEQKERLELILKGNLKYLEKDTKNWEDFVSFYSPKKSKKRFNVDTAFRYTIPLFEKDFINRNGKEYKYAEKFFIWNKKVGFVDLTCFYTDKAKQNFNEYWSEVEKMFEYREK